MILTIVTVVFFCLRGTMRGRNCLLIACDKFCNYLLCYRKRKNDERIDLEGLPRQQFPNFEMNNDDDDDDVNFG